MSTQLLHGEVLIVNLKSGEVHFRTVYGKLVSGAFQATNYQVRFKPDDLSHAHRELRHLPGSFFSMPNGAITRMVPMDNRNRETGKTEYSVDFLCKDFRRLQFVFESKASLEQVTRVIGKFAFPGTQEFMFAYQHSSELKAGHFDGWTLYDIEKDLTRQGVFTSRLADGRPTWRMADVNKDFAYSPTYPSAMCVPTLSSDEDLAKVASFRSRARIPSLTFMHPGNRTTLWRSSQPMVGVSGNTCTEDEALLNHIRSGCAVSATQRLLIADCRPKINALGNKAKGKGYETYKDGDLLFLNIQSIHVMRDSLNKVQNLCLSPTTSSDAGWAGAIEDTGWLKHVRLVIAGSIRVAVAMHRGGQSVLCHCSDGWDRTAQICAMVQMFLDPYYRTIEGFLAIISKDWLLYGHQFATRIGHGEDSYDSSERSPVYIQWLDAVWQLANQNPQIFEFSSQLLLFLAHHLYSCRFGDFLYNGERERRTMEVPGKLPSMWTFILERKTRFTNPFYDSSRPPVFVPPMSATLRNVRFWSDYYLRFSPLPSRSYAADYYATYESASGGERIDAIDESPAEATEPAAEAAGGGDGAPTSEADSAVVANDAVDAASVSDSEEEVVDDFLRVRRNFITVSDYVDIAYLKSMAGGTEAGDGEAAGAAKPADDHEAGIYVSVAHKFDRSHNIQPTELPHLRVRGMTVEDEEAMGMMQATTGGSSPAVLAVPTDAATPPAPPAGEGGDAYDDNPFGAPE